jgi:hypothetical protein
MAHTKSLQTTNIWFVFHEIFQKKYKEKNDVKLGSRIKTNMLCIIT